MANLCKCSMNLMGLGLWHKHDRPAILICGSFGFRACWTSQNCPAMGNDRKILSLSYPPAANLTSKNIFLQSAWEAQQSWLCRLCTAYALENQSFGFWLWEIFLSTEFKKETSILFLFCQLNFSEQRPKKASGGKTLWSLQRGHLKSLLTAGKSRSQDMKGKGNDDTDWIWRHTSEAAFWWRSYCQMFTCLQDEFGAPKSREKGIVSLFLQQKGLPLCQSLLWSFGDEPKQSLGLSIVHQESFPPQQPETDAERM